MAAAGGRIAWVGRVISVIVSLAFILSAFMKVKSGADPTQGMAHLGLRESLMMPLAILEFSCVENHLIQATSVP